MALHNSSEQQARNELENAERLGNDQAVVSARKRLAALGLDVERAAEQRKAAKPSKDDAPQGRAARKDDKAS